MSTGFTNSFTEGEICDDAWERLDIQPVGKGCELGQNLVIRIPGPLAKRRGFWRLGAVNDQTKMGRLVPFRRGINDAAMLEFGDGTVRVWSADGSPLMDGPDQVQFASPYGEAELALLRWKQVVDVIYFRTSDGFAPYSLSRITNTSWTFAAETFPNGPWQPENSVVANTLTLTGTDEVDTNPNSAAGSILTGQVVTVTASAAMFEAGHVGSQLRLRQNDGSPSVWSWAAGNAPPAGYYALSNGRVYVSQGPGGNTNLTLANTPLVVTQGTQTDGRNTFEYRHDGAGIVQITGFTDAHTVTGLVTATVPLQSAAATSCWAWGAYSAFFGWPTAWPEIVEERLAGGATASNKDFLDLTGTAAFQPASETYIPGLGTGAVIDTDAMRRRLGDDGSQIQWLRMSTFLMAGTDSGEFVISGGLFGSALAPSTIVCRQISDHGTADVYPAKTHKALYWATRGGEFLRKLALDLQQTDSGDDCTVLATHIGERVFTQLAWIPQPDNALWARLADGGVAIMTDHAEQQVRGWTRQVLGDGGWAIEDLQALPGPGKMETLWMIVSRTKAGVVQRFIIQQSRKSDKLFMDLAEFYEGAPVTTIEGLDHFDGEMVRILADGVQQPDQRVVAGAVHIPASSQVMVGQGYKTRFKSLKLATVQNNADGTRQRITGAIVTVLTSQCAVSQDGEDTYELIDSRVIGDIPGPTPKRVTQAVNTMGDAGRDPRLVIEEDTAYDHVIYAIRPQVAAGG